MLAFLSACFRFHDTYCRPHIGRSTIEEKRRGHWGRAYTNVFAGGGMSRGKVVGKTDAIGAAPVDRPLSAKDVLATIYHLVGIDSHMTLVDRLNRPVPLVPYGDVIREMLA